jgi:hypothetical protein
MKTIVIINNYINIDKSFLKKDQENEKQLFGIFSDDSILKKNDDKIKTSNLKINTNTDKLENNGNKTTITHSIGSKKFNIIKTDDLDGDFNYDVIRKIPKKKKRGRKPKKLSKRIHNALDQDNIIRKIQVHFLSFIIFFCNDLIQTILPNNKDLVFKNIVYEIKKTVNHAYIENLKSKSIGDILQLKASPKNKKFNDNINKIIFDKYLKLYKIGEKGFNKKNIRSNKNIFNKESPNYILNKYSNERNNSDKNKMSSLNMANNIQIKGLKKKNKSSNLLISNLNKPKNMYTSNQSSNVIISRFESNNNTNIKIKNSKINYKIDNANNNINNKNSKKYLTENHIMYLINKKASLKKRKNKNNKDKQMSLKNIKNDSNNNINTNTNNTNNNNSNSNYYLNNYFNEKKQNNENQENVIYDYSCNNILFNKFHNNDNFKNSKKNFRHNYDNENSENIYKMLNERLKTEYNDNSLEAIDKMYEEENTEELNQKSVSLSKRDGIRFLYPEIYNRDDEYYIENENNDKREKELDETESPLKMDTEKDNIENSGVLSFDQVKDIICYYNMNNPDKQNNFLFQKNERQIYDINYKNKYLNYFFGSNNINNDKKNNENNNNNDLFDDRIMFNPTLNYKYPNNSIFSY